MECSRRPGFPFVTVAAKAAQYFHQPHHLKEALLRFKSRSTQLKMQVTATQGVFVRAELLLCAWLAQWYSHDRAGARFWAYKTCSGRFIGFIACDISISSRLGANTCCTCAVTPAVYASDAAVCAPKAAVYPALEHCH